MSTAVQSQVRLALSPRLKRITWDEQLMFGLKETYFGATQVYMHRAILAVSYHAMHAAPTRPNALGALSARCVRDGVSTVLSNRKKHQQVMDLQLYMLPSGRLMLATVLNQSCSQARGLRTPKLKTRCVQEANCSSQTLNSSGISQLCRPGRTQPVNFSP